MYSSTCLNTELTLFDSWPKVHTMSKIVMLKYTFMLTDQMRNWSYILELIIPSCELIEWGGYNLHLSGIICLLDFLKVSLNSNWSFIFLFLILISSYSDFLFSCRSSQCLIRFGWSSGPEKFVWYGIYSSSKVLQGFKIEKVWFYAYVAP